MSHARRIDRWVRWATLWALVIATLSPGVAHALRHLRGDVFPWWQICSASGGMRRLQMPGDALPGQAHHAFEHCAACALHLDAASPPPVATQPVMRSDLAHALPTMWLHAPRPLHAWASAQARAPPAA